MAAPQAPPTVATTRPSIAAEALVPAPAEEVFGYLSDLGNHWQLADRFVEVLSLERPEGASEADPATGGRVRIRGPFGLHRTAATRVAAMDAPREMTGSAHVGRATTAEVRWTLTPSDNQTGVRLEARVLAAGVLDRLLLNLGGRAWLRRRFAGVLERLGEHFSPGGRTRRAGDDFSLVAAWLVRRVARVWLHDVRERLRGRAARRRPDRERQPRRSAAVCDR